MSTCEEVNRNGVCLSKEDAQRITEAVKQLSKMNQYANLWRMVLLNESQSEEYERLVNNLTPMELYEIMHILFKGDISI